MSIIRAIKHRLGLSVTPANNFVLTAEADNGTMKLARESGQDILTVDAVGRVAFPQMGQSLAVSGYVKLPGGLIIQWGEAVSSASAEVAITYPIPFPTAHLRSVASCSDTLYPVLAQIRSSSLSAGVVSAWISNTAARVGTSVSWIAIGY